MVIFLTVILLLTLIGDYYVIGSKVFSKDLKVYKKSQVFVKQDLIILGCLMLLQIVVIVTLFCL